MPPISVSALTINSVGLSHWREADFSSWDNMPDQVQAGTGIEIANVTHGLAGDEFLALADNLPVLCWVACGDGHVFWYNRRWYEYTGTSPESQNVWEWEIVVDPEKRKSVLEKWQSALSTGQSFEMIVPLKGADGIYRPFLTRAVPKRDEFGVITRWYGTNVDVSGQAKAQAEADVSEGRFRSFTDAMPNQVWTSTPAGQLNWFNPRVYEYCGAAQGELDGEGWATIVHPGDLPLAVENWTRALTTGVFYETEFRLRRSDGVYRWFIARATPIVGDGGAITLWIGTNTDIDDQKRATQALHESERRLVLSQNAAGIASLELDIATGNVIGSDGFWQLWGLSRRQSVHISVLEQLVIPEDHGIRSNAQTRRQGTAVPDVEYRIRRADTGELRWLWRSIDFVLDAAGTPVKMFGVMQDITERKAIEDSLRESEARYRSALTVGRMGSWETNFASGKRLWSPEGQVLFGLSLPDGIGHIGGESDEFRNALHPHDRHLLGTFHKLANTVDSFAAMYRIVRSGAVVWLSGRGQVFSRDSDGKCERLVNVVADISEQKKAEEHVRYLLREMSHRSKNLLAVIQSIARRTARTSDSNEEFRKKFDERLQGLAASHDILVEQNWRSVALRELVVRQLTPFADPKGARFEISGPDIDVNANAAQAIGLALHELGTNAVKYGALTSAHGKVTINWAVEHDHDTGDRLTLSWVEHGGPPVTEPSRKGFGADVLGRMAPASLSGAVVLSYAPTGFCWKLTAPMLSLTTIADNLPA